MNKLLIFLIFGLFLFPLISAQTVVDNHGVAFTASETVTNFRGAKVIFNEEVNLTIVTIDSSSTANNVSIFNETESLIASSSIVNNNATFGINLNANQIYIIAADMNGAAYNVEKAIVSSFPIIGNRLNWTFGYSASLPSNGNTTQIGNILSLTTTDYGPAEVNLTNPLNGIQTIETNIEFNASIDTSTGNDLKNATIFLYNQSFDLINNSFVTLSGLQDEAIYNISGLDRQNHTWNVYACLENSSETLCAFSGSNNTFTIQGFTLDAQEFESNVTDTDNSSFMANISMVASSNLIAASLIYDGTSYQATIDQTSTTTFTSNTIIDIPVATGPGNKSFHWELIIDPGGLGFVSENTAISQQHVQPSNFTSSVIGTPALNITLYDEETLKVITGQLAATYTWYIGGGTVTKSNAFNTLSGSEYLYYTDPTATNFYVSSNIFISNNTQQNTSYTERTYEFNKQLYNSSSRTDLKIYFANETLTKQVNIRVTDSGGIPLKNIFVSIERFYPGLNEYRIIENRKTDQIGTFSAKLREGVVDYRFKFYDSDNVLLKTETRIVICQNILDCGLEFKINTQEDIFSQYTNFSSFGNYSFQALSFNNVTFKVSFVYSDNRGDLGVTHALLVRKRSVLGQTTVVGCDFLNNTNVPTGSIICNVGNIDGNYIAEIYRYSSAIPRVVKIDSLEFTIGSGAGQFGMEGLFWAFILLFTFVALGVVIHPVVGISLYLIGFFALGITGIIYVNPLIFIANLLIGGLFIWAFR